MAYTLGEASKATGTSKTSLHRAIKSGRIPATKNASGCYEIDPAELHRVYPPVEQRNGAAAPPVENRSCRALAETELLRRELELLRRERDRERGRLEKQVHDLARRLDELFRQVLAIAREEQA